MIDYELERIRAAVDRVTDKATKITVYGARPRTIGVELLVEPTAELIERICAAVRRELEPDLALGFSIYEITVWKS